MQTEVRLVAAQASALRLPWDSPPELIEASAYNDKGDLAAAMDFRQAQDAVLASF